MDLHTGTPFWKTQNDVPFAFPTLQCDAECDVAIVGGGITGALVAYDLASHDKSIVLLEGRRIGQGSTLASTALLSHATDTHLMDLAAQIGLTSAVRVYRAGMEAVDKIESITRELGAPCGFERKCSLYFASTDQDVPELRSECDVRLRAGFPAEFWDANAIRRRCAFTAPAAIWSRGEGQVDAYALTLAILKQLVRRGVGIFEETCVTAIQRKRRGFAISTQTGRQVRAEHLVLATGYESQEYLRTGPARLMSTFAIASEPIAPVSGWPEDCLIWETARPYLYMRQNGDGRVIVGGEDESGGLTHDSMGMVTSKCRKLRQRFVDMFPSIPFETYCTWGGTFVDSPDGLPYIGTNDDFPGAWFALGYGGNGITFAVIAGQVIAAGLQGAPSPDADIFRFNRPAASPGK